MRRLVLTHKDRLLRFDSELIFAPYEIPKHRIVIVNKGEPPSFEEELVQEVIEITTVFSAQLYSRSHKTKRPLNELNRNCDKAPTSSPSPRTFLRPCGTSWP
jgi:predicted site-specific integrase-resolvase